MAFTHNISEADPLIIGEAKVLVFTIYTDATTDADIINGRGTIQDVSGYTFRWRLRTRGTSPSNVIEKSTASGISIIGVFNSDPDLNTQKVHVNLDASDWTSVVEAKHDHGLWRTDAGNEIALTGGSAVVKLVP